MQQQQQQRIEIQFINIPGVVSFPFMPFVVVVDQYEPDDAERQVTLILLGPGANAELTWDGEHADKVYHWYLNVTGQAKVVAPLSVV